MRILSLLSAACLAAGLLAGCSAAPPVGPEGPAGGLGSVEPSLTDEPDPAARPFSEEEKLQSRGKLGGVWTSCYRPFQPAGDPAEDLARLTSFCGQPAGLTALTSVRVGQVQGQDDAAERLVFQARGRGCYRIFAVGAPEVTDLDIAVLDPEGRLVAGDISRDRWPVVPPRGPFCLEQDGAYTVEVAVTGGRGAYVLQVWGD